MNHYETVFIMTPVLSEDQIKETVKRYISYLKANNAEIVSEENWGLKKLKYTIQKKKWIITKLFSLWLPFLSEDQIKETVKRYISYLKANNAEIVSEENWGLKKLKYTIQKKKSGFYYLIEYKANGAILSNMDVEFKRDETVLRWLTVKLEKFATEYAVRRRKRLSETKKSAE